MFRTVTATTPMAIKAAAPIAIRAEILSMILCRWVCEEMLELEPEELGFRTIGLG